MTGACHAVHGFMDLCVGARSPNPGFHACLTGTLPCKPPVRPRDFSLLYYSSGEGISLGSKLTSFYLMVWTVVGML